MKSPVEISLGDGNLGNGLSGADGLHCKVGVAEKGVAGKLYEINGEPDAKNIFGAGQLYDALRLHFEEGGTTCLAIRPTSDVVGSFGEVTKTGSGTVVLTVSGTATQTKKVLVDIVTGGAHETATYRFSLDDGVTWSDIYTTPAAEDSIVLFDTTTVVFGTGTFAAKDRYEFNSSAPTATSTEFLNAIDAMREQYDVDKFPYTFCHIVGGFGRSFWESVKAKQSEFEENFIFLNFVLESTPPTDGEDAATYFYALRDEANLFTAHRISVVGARKTYGVETEFRSAAIMLCAILSQSKVNQHPGWVEKFASKTGGEIEHWDVLKEIGDMFDTAKVIILRKYPNWPGIFIKDDWLMSLKTSDFQNIHHLRPADKVQRLAYSVVMPYVNSEEGVDGDAGGVETLKTEIDNIVSDNMEKAGEAEIKGHETVMTFEDDAIDGYVDIIRRGTNKKIRLVVQYGKEE